MQKINRRTVLTGSVVACAAAGFSPVSATTRAPNKHTVIIKKFKFTPDRITVRIGDTIEWINQDIVPHTATADAGDWDTEKLKKGESNSLEVTTNMTSSYFCVFHPKMKGAIIIE